MKNCFFILCLFLCGLFSYAQDESLQPVLWQPVKNDTLETPAVKLDNTDSLTVSRFNNHIALLRTLKKQKTNIDLSGYRILFVKTQHAGVHYVLEAHRTNNLSITEGTKGAVFKIQANENSISFDKGKYAVVCVTTHDVGNMYEYVTSTYYYLIK